MVSRGCPDPTITRLPGKYLPAMVFSSKRISHIDVILMEDMAYYFQMIHEGNNAVLLIATTYEEDTGIFTCRATTSAGTVETSAKLIVKSKN